MQFSSKFRMIKICWCCSKIICLALLSYSSLSVTNFSVLLPDHRGPPHFAHSLADSCGRTGLWRYLVLFAPRRENVYAASKIYLEGWLTNLLMETCRCVRCYLCGGESNLYFTWLPRRNQSLAGNVCPRIKRQHIPAFLSEGSYLSCRAASYAFTSQWAILRKRTRVITSTAIDECL